MISVGLKFDNIVQINTTERFQTKRDKITGSMSNRETERQRESDRERATERQSDKATERQSDRATDVMVRLSSTDT